MYIREATRWCGWTAVAKDGLTALRYCDATMPAISNSVAAACSCEWLVGVPAAATSLRKYGRQPNGKIGFAQTQHRFSTQTLVLRRAVISMTSATRRTDVRKPHGLARKAPIALGAIWMSLSAWLTLWSLSRPCEAPMARCQFVLMSHDPYAGRLASPQHTPVRLVPLRNPSGDRAALKTIMNAGAL